MKPPLGFILLTHSQPLQLQRLVARLNAMFDSPPIVWHHDFAQCAPGETDFPANISFVRPHVKTRWGEFSLVEATLRGMEQMLARADVPDQFVILSGSDYPIKPAARILSDLQAGGFDAHMEIKWVNPEGGQRDLRSAYKRYFCYNFPPQWLYRLLRRNWPMFTVRYPRLLRGLLPFSEELKCYMGSQWFAANRRAAEYILAFHRKNSRLTRFFRRTMFADECYFQTILGNASGFKLNNHNWRYFDWSQRTSHPKTLWMEDLPKLMASPAHFARKFDIERDPVIFDRLDEVTTAQPKAGRENRP